MFELAMSLKSRIAYFGKNDDFGAVTIDWVVLSAVVIVFAVGVSTLNTGSDSAISTAIEFINTLVGTDPNA